MTREEREEWAKALMPEEKAEEFCRISDKVYEDIERYLKLQIDDQRRDFRDRCIFYEVLEYIGGCDGNKSMEV